MAVKADRISRLIIGITTDENPLRRGAFHVIWISRPCSIPPPIWSFPRRWEEQAPKRTGRPASEDSAVTASEHVIAFSHVSISFDGRPVLEDVSFFVNRGQTLCILGRSGVGKSVALRMLMGFLNPDEGSIRVEGQEIIGLDEEGIAGHPQAHHYGLPERRALRFPQRARECCVSAARV